jgi:hypothetical protein
MYVLYTPNKANHLISLAEKPVFVVVLKVVLKNKQHREYGGKTGTGARHIVMKGGNMLITEIDKNTKEKIRVSIDEFRGHKFISVRVYFEDDKGQWLPTKKGITLNGETIDPVIEALQKGSKKLENKSA